MDPRRRDRIKVEFKKAEEYLSAAEHLQKQGLYTPSATSSYYSAYHAATAAFLTVGFDNPHKERFVSFMTALQKYSSKLDPYIEKLETSKDAWAYNAAIDYGESDSLLRFYQTRDFVLEIKDFLRRAVKL
ncbi:MAG: HEPN domain-containing protein [Deltaproteobacteria bacterium]|nr:HEPN domain-containing protein [Deltaproteobacteria bacterium]